jgi:hypothetical protein
MAGDEPEWMADYLVELGWVAGYVSTRYPDIYQEALAARKEDGV